MSELAVEARDPKGNRVYPSLPLATYFVNAGVSLVESVKVEAYIRAEVRNRLIRMRREHDPGQRFRYMNDREFRLRVNRELIAEVILGLGFSPEELKEIERGLKLGLVRSAGGPATARVVGPLGESTFTLEEERPGPDGQRYVLKDARTGEHEVVE